jgi:transcriptional regulator with XRE-family HTH domain
MTQTEWREIFGANLVDILKERNLSQAQLAKETGLSTSRISDYIKGYATPNIFAIINMAYVLGLDISEFVDFEEPIKY